MPFARSTLVLCALLAVASAAALPAGSPAPGAPGTAGPHPPGAQDTTKEYPNQAVISVALFSGVGRSRRDVAAAGAVRPPRQLDGSALDEDFSAESDDYADGEARRRRRFAAIPTDPRSPTIIESPFTPTSDVEDAHRVRRVAQDVDDTETADESSEDVDHDHFPKEHPSGRANKRAASDYTDGMDSYDDAYGFSHDEPGAEDRRRRRQADEEDHHDDDDGDVYRDLDDEPLPSWARNPRRQRRQIAVEPDDLARGGAGDDDDDEPDYLRHQRDADTGTQDATTTAPGESAEADRADKDYKAVDADGEVTSADGSPSVNNDSIIATSTSPAAPGSTKTSAPLSPDDSRSDSDSSSSDSSSSDSSSSDSSSSDSSSSDSSSSDSGSSSSSEAGSSAPAKHRRRARARSESESTEYEESAEASGEPLGKGFDALVRGPRRRRSPQQRLDGFAVLADFSGFRRGRSARLRRDAPSSTPTEAQIVQALLEAPIDEAILGELPVRRPRQAGQLIPPAAPAPGMADGSPVSYIEPLSPSGLAVASPNSTTSSSPTGEKVLQIYTVHDSAAATPADAAQQQPAVLAPLVPVVVPLASADAATTTPPPPIAIAAVPVLVSSMSPEPQQVQVDAVVSSAAQPASQAPSTATLAAVPALVPQSAVSQVLAPGPLVHVDIVPPPATGPSEAAASGAPAAEPQLEQPLVVMRPPPAMMAATETLAPAQPDLPAISLPEGLQPPQPEAVDAFLAARPAAPPRQYFDVGNPSTPPCDAARPASLVPLVEKSVYVGPDGTYMFSYETADGVKVAEAGAQREIAAVEPNAESAGVPGAPMNTRLANTVSGGYSYTAPDGTYFNLRYVADENGFRPVVRDSFPVGWGASPAAPSA